MEAQPGSIPRQRKILFSAVATVAALLILEGVARILVPSHAAVYREHENIITVLGLPGMNRLMTFDPHLFWVLKPNLEHVRVSGQLMDAQIDFSVSTNELGLRGRPVAAKGSKTRILALGDSCTFGVGVNDDETWPAQLEGLLNGAEEEAGYEVINAGVPGYTAFQGLRFLEEHGLELVPDLIIASFGFNDRDTWASRSDLQTAKLMLVKDWEAPLMHSRFYAGLRRLHREMRSDSTRRTSQKRPRLSAEEFADKLVEIERLCERRDIPLWYLIWPTRGQILRGSSERVLYQPIIAQTSRDLKVPVVNLVESFLTADRPLFVDHIHANSRGCGVAAEAIARRLSAGLLAKTGG